VNCSEALPVCKALREERGFGKSEGRRETARQNWGEVKRSEATDQ